MIIYLYSLLTSRFFHLTQSSLILHNRSFYENMRSSVIVTAVVSLLTINTNALKLDLDSAQSIKDAAKTIVSHILSIYDGPSSSGIPGLFPDNYFWWGSGLAFDSLINYAMVTGDDAYNGIISKGLLWQVGPNNDFMPQNQSSSIGNDGQSIWALAAMTAAEQGFPDPPANSGVDSWLQLAKNVFDSQVLRWDNKTCDGGLRWQIYSFNTGYQYKNTLSNGDFMQLAARLARYTGNSTYSDWAARVSSWSLNIGFIDTSFAVYDGATTNGDCKKINKIEWTSNLGTYLSSYLYMYNMVRQEESPLLAVKSSNADVIAVQKETMGL